MNETKVTVNRPLVGLIALACLCAFAGFWFAPAENAETNYQMWAAAFGRVGLLMGALWLALPGKGREAAWATVNPATLLGLLLAIFGIVRFPRVAIPFLLVLAVIGFVLRPRDKYRPPRR